MTPRTTPNPKLTRPLAASAVAIALAGLTACASTPAPTAEAPTPALEPAAQPIAVAPAAPDTAYPWLVHPWNRMLIVTTSVPEAWLGGPIDTDAETNSSETIIRPLDLAKLPKTLTEQVGRELRVVDVNDPSTVCRVKVTGLHAMAWVDSEVDSVDELYPDQSDGVTTQLTPEQFAATVWKIGRRAIVASYEASEERTGCDEPFIAAPEDALPIIYTKTEDDPAEVKRAVAAVRAHSLWAIQEDAYQRSLALAKTHKKALAKAGYDVEFPKKVPAHWDESIPERDWSAVTVEDWADPSGAVRYHLVDVGNGLSCASPSAWFLYDADFGSALAYGFGITPELLLDLDRDGTPELAREGYPARWIERIDPKGADQPEVLRAAWGPPEQVPLDCAWEQIPPLSVIDEVLHPKPKPPGEGGEGDE